MKRRPLYRLTFIFVSSLCSFTKAQDATITRIPSVAIYTVDGLAANSGDFSNKGKPLVIDFWATWCRPCVMELNAIADKYDYWQKQTGVKVIIVAVDSASPQSQKVAAFVRNRQWRYAVYLDPYGNLQNAMQVMDTPCTFVVNGNGKIVYMHNSYLPGDEDKVFDVLEKLKQKK